MFDEVDWFGLNEAARWARAAVIGWLKLDRLPDLTQRSANFDTARALFLRALGCPPETAPATIESLDVARAVRATINELWNAIEAAAPLFADDASTEDNDARLRPLRQSADRTAAAVRGNAGDLRLYIPLAADCSVSDLRWLTAEAHQLALYQQRGPRGLFAASMLQLIAGEGTPTWDGAEERLPNWRRFHRDKHEIIRQAESLDVRSPASLRAACNELVRHLRVFETGPILQGPPSDILKLDSTPPEQLELQHAYDVFVGSYYSYSSKDLIDAVLSVVFRLPSTGERPARPSDPKSVSEAIRFLFAVIDWCDRQIAANREIASLPLIETAVDRGSGRHRPIDPKERLCVDTHKCSVTLDGVTYVDLKQSLVDLLKRLHDNFPNPVGVSDIGKPARILENAPEAIKSLIDAVPAKGTAIRL